MSCEELLRLLDEDGDITSTEAREHLASCPSCAAAVARATAVRRELAAMASEVPPPFLHVRIMAHVRSKARAPERARARRWRLALAPVVAVVVFTVVVVGGGSLWLLKEKVSRSELGVPSPASRVAEVAAKAAPAEPVAKGQAAPEAPGAKDKGVADAEGKLDQQAVAPQLLPPQPVPRLEGPTAPSSVPVADEWRQEHQRRSQVTGALPPAAPAPLATAERERASDLAAEPSPGLGGAPEREQPDADRAGSEESAKKEVAAAAGGATTQTLQASPGRRSAQTECTVWSETGVKVRRLVLPDILAPLAGQDTSFTVLTDGSVRLDEGDGQDEPRVAAGSLERELAGLELPPGRYRLARSAS